MIDDSTKNAMTDDVQSPGATKLEADVAMGAAETE